MLAQDTEGYTQLAMDPQSGDDRLFVVFKLLPVENGQRSATEGRPIFEDQECVEIRIPGDKDNVICRVASDLDKRRFARQYAAFTQGKGEAIVGTPLDAVPWLTRSQAEEFRHLGVRSVEQLATLSDALAGKFMGFHSMKRRAQDFLDAAAGAAPAEKLRVELEARDAKIAALQAQLDQLAAAHATKAKG